MESTVNINFETLNLPHEDQLPSDPCIRQGCQMFLVNFLQVFKISSRFLKAHIFGSIFSLKLSLMYLNGAK